MRSLRYLNTVLTLIAVLLALHLWTLWMGVGSGAAAEAAPGAADSAPVGVGNAGAQRMQMVDLLKRLSDQSDELIGLFKSGRARVKVDAPKDDNPRR